MLEVPILFSSSCNNHCTKRLRLPPKSLFIMTKEHCLFVIVDKIKTLAVCQHSFEMSANNKNRISFNREIVKLKMIDLLIFTDITRILTKFANRI